MLRKGGTLFDRIFSWPLRIKCVSGTERRGAEDNETVCIFLTQISGFMNSSNTSLFRGLANRDKNMFEGGHGCIYSANYSPFWSLFYPSWLKPPKFQLEYFKVRRELSVIGKVVLIAQMVFATLTKLKSLFVMDFILYSRFPGRQHRHPLYYCTFTLSIFVYLLYWMEKCI